MNDIPIFVLLILLLVLLALSAFFSGSETGLMTVNRYRLKARADKGDHAAKLTLKLLERPDRLIGLILLGNNLVNNFAATVMALISLRVFPGETGLATGTFILTLIVLVFGEVMPKTLAALHPLRVALNSAYVYGVLRYPLFPLVWLVNIVSNAALRRLGVTPEEAAQHSLSTEELRTVVAEAGAMIPQRHQKMLLSILDLENGTVEDIMVPRNEIIGVDITDPLPEIQQQLMRAERTRLPIYNGSIDDLRGVIHLRDVIRLSAENRLTVEAMLALAREPYFIPEGTPLNQQLINFQNQGRRLGFVVDEYGDIQGLASLEDLLAEIVGEFTTDPNTRIKNVYVEPEGSYRVGGNVTLRSLNRALGWNLPTSGPRTVNGLLIERLQQLPEPGAVTAIRGYRLEILETSANAVRSVRITPHSGRS